MPGSVQYDESWFLECDCCNNGREDPDVRKYIPDSDTRALGQTMILCRGPHTQATYITDLSTTQNLLEDKKFL